MIEYRGYRIFYDPPPIGIRSCDWQFHVDGYDGADDSKDNRCGHGPSEESCRNQIDELIEEEECQLLVKRNSNEEFNAS